MLPKLDGDTARRRIARRVATDLKDGFVVNLGIGIPTLVPDYIPEDVHIILQTENGAIGAGPKPDFDDPHLVDAGGESITLMRGAAIVPSDFSFGLMRGGHLDVTVLGAFQVDEEGNLANWCIPGKLVPGMGGAMDLVSGTLKVTVAMTHMTSDGKPKILKKCALPLTGAGIVDTVVTEFCLMRRISGRLVLCEIAPEVTADDIRSTVTADFDVSHSLARMEYPGGF